MTRLTSKLLTLRKVLMSWTVNWPKQSLLKHWHWNPHRLSSKACSLWWTRTRVDTFLSGSFWIWWSSSMEVHDIHLSLLLMPGKYNNIIKNNAHKVCIKCNIKYCKQYSICRCEPWQCVIETLALYGHVLGGSDCILLFYRHWRWQSKATFRDVWYRQLWNSH